MLDVEAIEEGLARVRGRIAAACARAGREPQEVRVIGVTKHVPAAAVAAARSAGLEEFGENYLQELEAKREQIDATWHFIGRLQRNKVRRVLAAADVVQTLEPGRAGERFVVLAGERDEPLPCLVEVDLTGQRVGVAPEELPNFVTGLREARGIALRGLMTVAPLGQDPRPAFRKLRELRDRVREGAPELAELSMGMSADLDAAIEEGATMVRVGSAIFGARPRP